MKQSIRIAAFAVLLAAATAGIAWAQAGPGRSGFQNSPGSQSGQGFMNGPMVFGTVRHVYLSDDVITVSDRQGNDRMIHVSDGTRIVTEKSLPVSDAKIGDRIEVRGVPTSISAESLIAATSDSQAHANQVAGPPGGAGPRPLSPAGRGMDFAIASGRIVSKSPLTIRLADGDSLVVKVKTGTRLHKLASVSLSSVKAGDRVVAFGTPTDDGALDASQVAVNVNIGVPGGGGPPSMMGGGPMGPGPGFGPPPVMAGGPNSQGADQQGDGQGPPPMGPDDQQGPPPPDGQGPDGGPPPDGAVIIGAPDDGGDGGGGPMGPPPSDQ